MTKVYVLDANALVVWFQQDKGFERVRQLLKEAQTGKHALLMSMANWSECYSVILRTRGEAFAQQARMIAETLPIEVVPVTGDSALLAAEIRVRHQLPLLDSFAAALAIANHATLVTGDADFQKVAARIPILWLRRP